MAQPCSICNHPDREAIDKALVSGASLRDIAGRFKVSRTALGRHKLAHLPETLKQARALLEVEKGINVALELRSLFDRAKQLLDACDLWLADPANPGTYNIDPRANDVAVVYTEPGEKGKPVRKKAALSTLLHQVGQEQPDLEFVFAESKVADPRELLLKTMAVMRDQLAMFGQLYDVKALMEKFEELERRLNA